MCEQLAPAPPPGPRTPPARGLPSKAGGTALCVSPSQQPGAQARTWPAPSPNAGPRRELVGEQRCPGPSCRHPGGHAPCGPTPSPEPAVASAGARRCAPAGTGITSVAAHTPGTWRRGFRVGMAIFSSPCLCILTAVSWTQREMVNVKKVRVQFRWHLSLTYSVPLMFPSELDRNGCSRKGSNILSFRNHAPPPCAPLNLRKKQHLQLICSTKCKNIFILS